ncbi:hypothetical protein BDY19DRAFT_394013 [Irpex rosettiformis]|uniref:Uncharacterized protein n=1 Tax=Irpex rosettiformis TaxID=378272 RepID=A0ACB8TVI0_9APHY|nr:hypothetical protein BDY19DRAFT_394013 [Irpex rosettiformis]
MVKQMVNCLHGLRHDALILHRDISSGNIMYKGVLDGKDRFVLTDFDLAVFTDKNGQSTGPTSHHRTGTLPFMAFDLISNMADSSELPLSSSEREHLQHCVRHDFESLFWVSLWCAVSVVSPGKEDPVQKQKGLKYLSRWEEHPLENVANQKQAIITGGSIQLKKAPLSPSFKHLYGWLKAFCSCIQKGLQANINWVDANEDIAPPFKDYETGHGMVTRDELFKAFTDYEKALPKP